MTPFTLDGRPLPETPEGTVQLGAVRLVPGLAKLDDPETRLLVVIGLVQLAALSDPKQLPIERRLSRLHADVSMGRFAREDAFS